MLHHITALYRTIAVRKKNGRKPVFEVLRFSYPLIEFVEKTENSIKNTIMIYVKANAVSHVKNVALFYLRSELCF